MLKSKLARLDLAVVMVLGGRGLAKVPLPPKTKKLIQAQAHVLGKDGGIRPLVHGDVSAWEQVEEQLAESPAPVVKPLLQQMCPDSTVPRLKQDVVKLLLAELQCKGGAAAFDTVSSRARCGLARYLLVWGCGWVLNYAGIPTSLNCGLVTNGI